jgi:hypothetical protein
MERQGILLPARALILATLLVSGIAVAQDGEPQGPAAPAEALTAAFTYQGQIEKDGSPVNDACDMAFRLYDQATDGAQVGSAITATVPITDGLFTVTLDFGAGAFNGDRRWLGIAVDCEEDGNYADLGRQELTAAPYAQYAMGAPWDGLTGVPAGFADGVDDDTTYSAGFGLTLGGTTFGVVTSTVQQRVTGACSVGYAIRRVNADGSVVCEQDNDTIYTAGEGLVLDGTEFSAQGSSYANVVVVAKSGGDHKSVQKAIESITDAAEDNAYLVWVAPGVYEEQVTMKPYVHLQGAGQEATIITSTVSSSSLPPGQATLVLTRTTSLRDLTVGNGGTGACNVALLATAGTTQTLVVDVTARALGGGMLNYAIFLTGSGTDVTLRHITGLAEDGNGSNYGLFNVSGAEAVLCGGSFTARGGTNTCGISNSGSGTTLEADGVTALAGDGGTENHGLRNESGAGATLRGGSFTAHGESDVYGIYNDDSGTTLEATGVTALGEDGDYNCGLRNESGAAATLHGGSFTARGGYDTFGIFSSGSGTTLEADGVTALAEDGGNENHGLRNESGAAATLRGGSFTAREGYDTFGIFNYGSGTTLEAEGVTTLAEDGCNTNYGLYNYSSATAGVDSSRLTGSDYSLYLRSGTVYLGVTQLDGGAHNGGGTLTCFQVYDENYADYTCP